MPRSISRTRARVQARSARAKDRRGRAALPGRPPWADALIEAGWLAAIVATALAFAVHSPRPYEPLKNSTLRIAAAVMGAAWLVAMRARGKAPAGALRGRLRGSAPVLWGLGAYLAIQVASVTWSVSPWRSLVGDPVRGFGVATSLATGVMFLCARSHAAGADRLRRMLDALVVTGLVTAAYALLQGIGMDPVRAATGGARAHAALGNPIAAGAYLAMTIPLTLHAVLTCGIARARRMALVVALLAQGLALLATDSRGPVLALAAALVFYGLARAVLERRRLAFRVATVGAAVGALLLVAGVATAVVVGPKALRHGPLSGLARTSSSGVRVLVWRGAVAAATETPARLLLGSGPDTLRQVFPPHMPRRLEALQGAIAIPVRAHNETLDVLSGTGLVGVAGYLVLMVLLWAGLLRRVGLVASRLESATVGGAALVAGVGGLAVAWAIGGAALVAVGFGVGALGGLLLGILGIGIGRFRRTVPEGRGGPVDGLRVAMMAALVGHLAEVQVAFPVSATALLFWLLSGAVLARPEDGEAAAPSPSPDVGPVDGTPAASAVGALSAGVIIGAGLGYLLLEFAWLTDGAGSAGAMALGAVVVLGTGAALVGGKAAGIRTLLVALAMMALATGLHAVVAPSPRGPDMAEAVSVVVWFQLLVLGTLAAIVARAPGGRGRDRRSGAGGVVAVVAAAGLVLAFELPPLRADGAIKPGIAARDMGLVGPSLRLLRLAAARAPRSGEARLELAKTLSFAAAKAKNRGQQQQLFTEAEGELTSAARLAPQDPDVLGATALLAVQRAQGATRDEREARLRAMNEAFERATAQAPNGIVLWSRWCEAAVALGDHRATIRACGRRMALPTAPAGGSIRLGIAHLALGDPEAALGSLPPPAGPRASPGTEVVRARALDALGRSAEAGVALEGAAARWPASRRVAAARRRRRNADPAPTGIGPAAGSDPGAAEGGVADDVASDDAAGDDAAGGDAAGDAD